MQTVHFRNWLKWIQTRVSVKIKKYNGADVTFSSFPNTDKIGLAVYNSNPYNGLSKWISNGDPSSWSYGVIFGDGDTPPTENDYFLSGQAINTLTVASGVTSNEENGGIVVRGTYTITNISDADVTIREVGMFGGGYNGTNWISFLIDREVLDAPLTIPAGGIGQVVYTIKVS